jgi:hypothetical protein
MPLEGMVLEPDGREVRWSARTPAGATPTAERTSATATSAKETEAHEQHDRHDDQYQGAVEWVAANTVASVSDNPPAPMAGLTDGWLGANRRRTRRTGRRRR